MCGMKQNQRNSEQEQNQRTGQNREGLMNSQENNESLNTSSQEQPVQNLRNEAAGSGRSYDYGSENSPEQGLEGGEAKS